MKFRVSSKVKGSLILKTIGKPVSAGSPVYIEGNNLYATDVQLAIKSGLLTAFNSEEKIKVEEEIVNRTSEAVIVNKTDRVVIIGNIAIRPNGSTIKEISQLDMNAIKKAIAKGQIQVITDVNEELFEEIAPKKVKDIAEVKSVQQDKKEEKDTATSFVWDFRSQKINKPQVVPKTNQLIIDSKETEDIDMVDALDEINKVEDPNIKKKSNDISKKIASIKKTVTKKKKSKKKEIGVVRTKPIETEPVKEIAPALDSMGNLLKNDMTHLVDSIEKEDISFVDDEISKNSIKDVKKRDSTINIDFD